MKPVSKWSRKDWPLKSINSGSLQPLISSAAGRVNSDARRQEEIQATKGRRKWKSGKGEGSWAGGWTSLWNRARLHGSRNGNQALRASIRLSVKKKGGEGDKYFRYSVPVQSHDLPSWPDPVSHADPHDLTSYHSVTITPRQCTPAGRGHCWTAECHYHP